MFTFALCVVYRNVYVTAYLMAILVGLSDALLQQETDAFNEDVFYWSH